MAKKVYTLKTCDGINGVFTNVKRVFEESMIDGYYHTPVVRVWKDKAQSSLVSKPATYRLVSKELNETGCATIEWVNEYDETISQVEIERHFLNQ